MGTGALVALSALSAVTGATAQKQMVTSRRAETRSRSVIAMEQARQKEQSLILAKEEKTVAKRERQEREQLAGKLRAIAGRRSGRRSLISGAETGVSSQLGQQQQLG